jgi:APA family basic amino acid/polyamine antiporter
MLILEYLFAASTVAVGWSGYFNSLLQSIGHFINVPLALPAALSSAPLAVTDGHISTTGSLINLPAVLIVAAISWVCYVGVTQSASLNAIVVAIKLVVILLFVAFSLQFVNSANWHPFVPPEDASGHFGWWGVGRAASIVFFSYIGFDAVSTAAQEAKNPQRDMPIGILGSLVICTVLYIIVSAVLTGIAPYTTLGTEHPVSTALEGIPSLSWLRVIIDAGAIAGLSSVILVMLMGQPRIFYTMARDGLMPPAFGKIHPKYQTPYVGQIIVGIIAALLAGLLPIKTLGDLVSMGTLLAFTTVCIGVLVLRKTRPDLPRAFRVPAAPVVCTLGALSCFALFALAFKDNVAWMSGWIIIGLLVYFFYGYKRSKLRGAQR